MCAAELVLAVVLSNNEFPEIPTVPAVTFITALFLVFALAGGTSVMALTVHGSTYLTQSAYTASNQKATLLC